MGHVIDIKYDVSRCAGALQELSRLTGKSFREITRFETGKILESAARKVSAASAATIKRNHANRTATTIFPETYEPQSNRHRRTWQVENPSKISYWLNNRYPAALWSMIQAQRKKRLAQKMAARGLGKKVFLQLALKLNLVIYVAGYVHKATTPKGDYPEDAHAREVSSGSSFTIECMIERTYPRNIFLAITSGIKSRTSYFERNLRNGVFTKAREIARRYPGLYVNG